EHQGHEPARNHAVGNRQRPDVENCRRGRLDSPTLGRERRRRGRPERQDQGWFGDSWHVVCRSREALKRVVVRNGRSLRQQLKHFHGFPSVFALPIVMMATAPTMTAAASRILILRGSPMRAHPRKTATTGFTYA